MSNTVTRYINDDATVSIAHFNENMISETLPIHIYRVKYQKMAGFFLEKVFNEFKVPSKIYGNVYEKAERICKRYEKDNKSLGALLLGAKGSGKTLLATVIIDKFIKQYNKAVIIVDNNFGELNSEMISFISQFNNCLFIFDEFEKLFKRQDQELFLNFFDDKFNNNRLSLVISNDSHISEFLLDRPSRFFYKYNYNKLDNLTIKEILQDHNLSDMYEDFITMKAKMDSFSFDIINNIVDEVLLCDCKDLEKITKDMNVSYSKYSLSTLYDYQVVDCKFIRGDEFKSFEIKPLSLNEIIINYESKSGYKGTDTYNLSSKDIIKVKEDEITYMLHDWYFETEEDSKDEEYTSNMYYELTLKASLNNKLPSPV